MSDARFTIGARSTWTTIEPAQRRTPRFFVVREGGKIAMVAFTWFGFVLLWWRQ